MHNTSLPVRTAQGLKTPCLQCPRCAATGQCCEQVWGKHLHPHRHTTVHSLHNLHLHFWQKQTLKVRAAKENVLRQKKESIVKAKWNGLQESQAVPEACTP